MLLLPTPIAVLHLYATSLSMHNGVSKATEAYHNVPIAHGIPSRPLRSRQPFLGKPMISTNPCMNSKPKMVGVVSDNMHTMFHHLCETRQR